MKNLFSVRPWSVIGVLASVGLFFASSNITHAQAPLSSLGGGLVSPMLNAAPLAPTAPVSTSAFTSGFQSSTIANPRGTNTTVRDLTRDGFRGRQLAATTQESTPTPRQSLFQNAPNGGFLGMGQGNGRFRDRAGR
jgi:hypothetical protein